MKKKIQSYIWLILGSILIITGVSILLYIFLPLFYHQSSQKALSKPQEMLLEKNLDNLANPQEFISSKEGETIFSSDFNNHLVILSAKIDIPLIQSESSNALSRGAWIYPFSALPGEKGNTVISGHRFQYFTHRSNSFYSLSKIQQGDTITVYWENKTLNYTVSEIFEVDPQEVNILEKGNEEKLTLYTCTPLFTTLKRLVIIALPVSSQ
jgi:sortase A